MDDCLFCKIIAGKIPSKKVYEDDKVFAFEDIDPKAPTHVLIIPKKHLAGLKEATAEDAEILGYCQLVAAKIGRERSIEDGYRTAEVCDAILRSAKSGRREAVLSRVTKTKRARKRA